MIFKYNSEDDQKIQEFENWAFDNRDEVIEESRWDDRYYSSTVYVAYKVKNPKLINWMLLKYDCFIKTTDYEGWLRMRKMIDESSNYTIDWKKNG